MSVQTKSGASGGLKRTVHLGRPGPGDQVFVQEDADEDRLIHAISGGEHFNQQQSVEVEMPIWIGSEPEMEIQINTAAGEGMAADENNFLWDYAYAQGDSSTSAAAATGNAVQQIYFEPAVEWNEGETLNTQMWCGDAGTGSHTDLRAIYYYTEV